MYVAKALRGGKQEGSIHARLSVGEDEKSTEIYEVSINLWWYEKAKATLG